MAIQPQIQHVDIPEVTETFIDSTHGIIFDGRTFRIELCVTRLGEPEPPAPPSGRRYTACRLVMTPDAAAELANKIQQLAAAMAQQAAGAGQPSPQNRGTLN